MPRQKLKQPLKWYGGKYYLADWIISLMPKHLHYVEPYAGGLSVLLNKSPFDVRHQWGSKSQECGISEVVNDKYLLLTNFWGVLQNKEAFELFKRSVEAMPFSEIEWKDSTLKKPCKYLDVENALAFFVRCRQSRAGSFKSFATLSRNRTRGLMNEQVSAWLSCIDGLAAVHSRLKRVVILCGDALNIIKQQDGDKALFYLDPPYLTSTRVCTGDYKHEMSTVDHEKLLDVVVRCKGSVMLSGYKNKLYDAALKNFNRHDKRIDNKMGGGISKRQMLESVWCNF